VEIINPGGLIGNLSIEDIYEKSIPRNPLLFGLMERMELVEKAGSGLVRIENAMREYRLELPEIKADKHWFHITFKRPDLQKSTYEDRIRSQAIEYGLKREDKNAPVNAPVKLTKLQENIIRHIRRDKSVTYDQPGEFFKKGGRRPQPNRICS
jgi:ATP-dependent DNA helicase RecG